jgi:hypothetical protein
VDEIASSAAAVVDRGIPTPSSKNARKTVNSRDMVKRFQFKWRPERRDGSLSE